MLVVLIDKKVRYDLFEYSWNNLVEGGYILINNSIVKEFKELYQMTKN